jgi:hypothetical protein
VLGTKRNPDLGSLLKQLRAEHVREYEEDEAGNVRVVFDDSAFVAVPDAKPKDKVVERHPHSAAIIALKGFKHEPIG